jgi:hypothetical protein
MQLTPDLRCALDYLDGATGSLVAPDAFDDLKGLGLASDEGGWWALTESGKHELELIRNRDLGLGPRSRLSPLADRVGVR